MSKADITIRGKQYSIACAPGQEARLVALSHDLDDRVAQISGAVGDIGEAKLLLIAALALLDELDDARNIRPANSGTEKAATALGDAAQRIAALAERIEAAQ
jgi:cell division protein ZapA